MSAAGFQAALLVETVRHASRIVAAALRGRTASDTDVYDEAPRTWSRAMLRRMPVTVDVHGLERVDWSRPCVVAANHASHADVWLLLSVLPGRLRFVAKKELTYLPLFGRAMVAAGHIVVDRRHRASALASYDQAARAVREGASAVVFVEGTRSADGTLQPFKKGAFVLAIAAGVPLVPVWIGGTHGVLPKGSLRPRPGRVVLRVGAPIDTAGLGYADRDALARRCRDAMVALARE